MPAYIIAEMQITDSVRYDAYRKLSSMAMQLHGARPLIRGGRTERLEGREPGRLVMLEFNSMEAARAFYDSDEYKKAREAREGAAVMNMLIVEGL